MPCRPARARRLLRAGRARVVKRFPFVIRLVDRTVEQSEVQPVLIKLDPGSRETGAAGNAHLLKDCHAGTVLSSVDGSGKS